MSSSNYIHVYVRASRVTCLGAFRASDVARYQSETTSTVPPMACRCLSPALLLSPSLLFLRCGPFLFSRENSIILTRIQYYTEMGDFGVDIYDDDNRDLQILR